MTSRWNISIVFRNNGAKTVLVPGEVRGHTHIYKTDDGSYVATRMLLKFLIVISGSLTEDGCTNYRDRRVFKQPERWKERQTEETERDRERLWQVNYNSF